MSTPRPDVADRLRRRQVAGLLLIAAGILLFTLLRAGRAGLFPPGWWRW